MAIGDEGFDVETANNGAEALDQVSRQMPDVIVLDLHMPIMTGTEFLEEYCARYVQRAPVIVCSTHRRDLSERLIGVAAFISKPLDLDDLISTIIRVAP